MGQWLSAVESKLSIDETEKLLIQRNAAPGTTLYRAHFHPAWLTSSTLSFLMSGDYAEVALQILGDPEWIDEAVDKELFQEIFDQVMDPITTGDWPNQPHREPPFVEERAVIPLNLVQYYNRIMRDIGALDLVSSDNCGLDGILVSADMLVLQERKNHFEDWCPDGKQLQYFWTLCSLALESLKQPWSLKYLVALATWL